MLGGIRGIKALRVQREYIQDVDEVKAGGNRFAKYEKNQEEEKKQTSN